ncbi:MAG: hypothetical protein K2Y71_04865 [Xanthobacteraceae bacterium]|nr:hypothetical protein [Xanthobacteraceae bacterium]
MLDGQRYFSEFPDEEPEQPKRLLLSDELIVTLAAIEREISEFIGSVAEAKSSTAGAAASDSQVKD